MNRTSIIATLSLLCCLEHSARASTTLLRSGFHNSLFLNPFYSFALTVLVVCFQIFWIAELRDQIPTHNSSSFHFIFEYHFNFSFATQNFHMLQSKAMLCIDQSSVNLQQKKGWQHHYPPVELFYYFHFPDLEIIILLLALCRKKGW
jgi:hypothetical protein